MKKSTKTIAFITLLVLILTCLSACSGSVRENGYDCHIAITSENGFCSDTCENIGKYIEKYDGIAEGRYVVIARLQTENGEKEITVASANEFVDVPRLSKGNLPERTGEVLISEAFKNSEQVGIGDMIRISGEFICSEVKITGILKDDYPKSADADILLLKDDFIRNGYDMICICVASPYEKIDEDGFADRIADISGHIKNIEAEHGSLRNAALTDDADAAINELKIYNTEVIEKYHCALKNAREELDEALGLLNDGKPGLAEGRKKLDKASGKAAEGKAYIKNIEKLLNEGLAALNEGRSMLDSYKKEYYDRLSQFGISESELDDYLKKAELASSDAEKAIALLTTIKNNADDISAKTEKVISAVQSILPLIERVFVDEEAFYELKETITELLSGLESIICGITDEITIVYDSATTLKEIIPSDTDVYKAIALTEDAVNMLKSLEELICSFSGSADDFKKLCELKEKALTLLTGLDKYPEIILNSVSQIPSVTENLKNAKKTADEAVTALKKGIEARDQLKSGQILLAEKEKEYKECKRLYDEYLRQYRYGIKKISKMKTLYSEKFEEYESGVKEYNEASEKYAEAESCFENIKAKHESRLKKWLGAYPEEAVSGWSITYPVTYAKELFCLRNPETQQKPREIWYSVYDVMRNASNYTVEISSVAENGDAHISVYRFTGHGSYISGDPRLLKEDLSEMLPEKTASADEDRFDIDIELKDSNIDHSAMYFIRDGEETMVCAGFIKPSLWANVSADIPDEFFYHASLLNRMQFYGGLIDREVLVYDEASGTFYGENIPDSYTVDGETRRPLSVTISIKNGRLCGISEEYENEAGSIIKEDIAVSALGSTWIRLPENTIDEEIMTRIAK